jgi:hypothetical protein
MNLTTYIDFQTNNTKIYLESVLHTGGLEGVREETAQGQKFVEAPIFFS